MATHDRPHTDYAWRTLFTSALASVTFISVALTHTENAPYDDVFLWSVVTIIQWCKCTVQL